MPRILCVCTFSILFLFGCAGGGNPLSGFDIGAKRAIDQYRAQLARQTAAAEAEADANAAGEADAPSVTELLQQGDRAREAGDLAEALFTYHRAHRTDDDLPGPRERIALVLLRKDPVHAEAILEELISTEPASSTLRTGLALAQLAQGRFEDARDSLARAIALDPEAATPRCLIGVILDRLGQHDAAWQQYEVAHEQRPDDYVILNNLGVSHLMAGDPAEAVAPLRKAARLEPRDQALRNNLGLALGLTGRYAEALDAFRVVNDEAEAQNNLGYVLYLNGEYERALLYFERALDAEGEALDTVLRNIELTLDALRPEELVEEEEAEELEDPDETLEVAGSGPGAKAR